MPKGAAESKPEHRHDERYDREYGAKIVQSILDKQEIGAIFRLEQSRNRSEKPSWLMNQDKEGQQILKQTDNTTKFDSLPGGEEMVRRKLVELYRPRRQNPSAKAP